MPCHPVLVPVWCQVPRWVLSWGVFFGFVAQGHEGCERVTHPFVMQPHGGGGLLGPGAANADLVEDIYPITGKVVSVGPGPGEFVLALEGHSKWLPLGPGVTAMNLDLREGNPGAGAGAGAGGRPLTFATRAIARHYVGGVYGGGGGGPLHVRVTLDLAVAPAADWSDRPDIAEEDARAAMADLAVAVQAPGALATLRGLTQNIMKPPCEQTPCEVLETLAEFVGAWGHLDGQPMEPGQCYHILQAGCLSEDGGLALGPGSPREALQTAAHVLFKLLSDLEARGRECDVFGDATGQAMVRTDNLRRTLLRVTLSLAAAECLANLGEAMSPEYDVTLPNFQGYSVVGRKPVSAKVKPKIEMTDYLLQYCAQRRLRHQGTMVFAEQCVPLAVDLRWRGAQCWAPGCTVAGPEVMFAPVVPGTRSTPVQGHRLCLEHAALQLAADPGAPIVNAVFQTGATWGADEALRRTATAHRPRWLVATVPATCRTSTKTWVPEVGRGGGLNVRPRTCGDLVVEALDNRLTNRVMWETYIGADGAKQALERYLTDTRDYAFPIHEPLTVLFAFNNGMYSIEENRFCPYGGLPTAWQMHGAINFINEHFDPLWTVQPTEHLGVSGYDDITRTQGYRPDTIAFLDAFLGRLFFPAKKYDHWQQAIVFLGTAGSGKSSIARAVALLLRDQNVGNLPSNCEEQWAVATLTGKVCVMCTEMKQDFKLPNSVLQCMIAGDPVTVHEKFKTAYDVSSWETQLMLVGNVMPTAWYVDEGSPMQRRAMVFHANIKPSTQDPSIQARFFHNLGPFLVRTTRRYRELADRIRASQEAGGKTHPRDFMPDQVVAFNNAFKNETSTAAVFLDHLLGLGMYELGFRDDFTTGSVVDLTKDAELVEFFRYLKDARAAGGAGAGTPRFPTLDLPEALSLAVAAARVGQHHTLAGLEEYVQERRVPLRALKQVYTLWWKDSVSSTGGAGGRAKNAPDFNNILREIGLPVSKDLDAPHADSFVFGLAARSSGAMGGAPAGGGGGGGGPSMSIGGGNPGAHQGGYHFGD